MATEATDRRFTLMVEPTPACNIACTYCYAECTGNGVMDFDTLRTTLDKVKNHADRHGFQGIDIVWQGGEPLMAGIDYFRRVQDLVHRWDPSGMTRQFLQTNGLLLTPAFARLFATHQVKVGISLDGPREMHDRHRVDHDGHGTFDRLMANVAMAADVGLPLGFNAVLTPLTLGCTDRLYRFFQALGYGFRVNPLMPGRHLDSGRLRPFRPGEYGRLLCELFDAWVGAPEGRVRVSPLDSYLVAVSSGVNGECQHGGHCMDSHLAVRADGGTLRCSRFSDAFLGWIVESDVEGLIGAASCASIEAAARIPDTCGACAYLEICNGGCPLHNINGGARPTSRDIFCTDYQLIFSHIRERLAREG